MPDDVISWGVVVVCGLTVLIYRLVRRGRVDFGVYIPRLKHFIGASRNEREAERRAREAIEHETEVDDGFNR